MMFWLNFILSKKNPEDTFKLAGYFDNLQRHWSQARKTRVNTLSLSQNHRAVCFPSVHLSVMDWSGTVCF